MVIGIPKEIKADEFRVAIVPSGVRALVEKGHRVLVENSAGLGCSIPDADYAAAGAEIKDTAEEVWTAADLVVKVKEPLASEYGYFRGGLVVFTFFHLAAAPALADALIDRKVTAVAYETTELEGGRLPILAPMSEVAGKLSVLAGADALMKTRGGRGVLLGGVPGVERGEVAVIGAGIVGTNAVKVALGLGTDVTVLNRDIEKLRRLDDLFPGRLLTLASSTYNIEKTIAGCDLLVGAVHVPGARTPTLVTREMLGLMKKGAVIVDVSVDQGGCVETIRPTTHTDPTYEVDGIIHYGVANMPGAVPRTSTFALTGATLPYVTRLADLGVERAASADPALERGINIHRGMVTHPSVAASLAKPLTPFARAREG
ncbi:MAG: alanine dehydrogenase [Thermodesulfobacteriota bacterium]